MFAEYNLQKAIDTGDRNGTLNAVGPFFRDLGYEKLVKACYCVEKPPKSKVDERIEKINTHYERFGKEYRPGERLYNCHINCSHFSNPNNGAGAIVIVEAHEEATRGVKLAWKRHSMRITKRAKRARRKNMGLIGMLKSLKLRQQYQSNARNIGPGTELGIVTCYCYEDACKETEKTRDFECAPGKNWRERLKIPNGAILEILDIKKLKQ